MMCSTLFISFWLILLPLSGASMVYTTSTGREVTMPVYSDLMAPAHFDMYNLTVVDLTRDVDVFDYCDLSKYNPLDIQPLLRAHGITGNTANNTKWITYYKGWNIRSACSSRMYISWDDTVIMRWNNLLVYHIQRAGALGHFFTPPRFITEKYMITPFSAFDRKEGWFVKGTKINIICAYIIQGDNAREFYEEVNSESNRKGNKSLVITSIQDDASPLDDAIYTPGSLYNILRPVAMVWSFTVWVYSLLVGRKYYRKHYNRLPLNYSTLAVVLTVVTGLLRIVKCVDLEGVSCTSLLGRLWFHRTHIRSSP
jgi:hypothetical protein